MAPPLGSSAPGKHEKFNQPGCRIPLHFLSSPLPSSKYNSLYSSNTAGRFFSTTKSNSASLIDESTPNKPSQASHRSPSDDSLNEKEAPGGKSDVGVDTVEELSSDAGNTDVTTSGSDNSSPVESSITSTSADDIDLRAQTTLSRDISEYGSPSERYLYNIAFQAIYSNGIVNLKNMERLAKKRKEEGRPHDNKTLLHLLEANLRMVAWSPTQDRPRLNSEDYLEVLLDRNRRGIPMIRARLRTLAKKREDEGHKCSVADAWKIFKMAKAERAGSNDTETRHAPKLSEAARNFLQRSDDAFNKLEVKGSGISINPEHSERVSTIVQNITAILSQNQQPDSSSQATSSSKASPSVTTQTHRSKLSNKSTKTLTHLTSTGAAHMVNITSKTPTHRVAEASSSIHFSNPEPLRLLLDQSLPKGDALATARLAGIMGAKKTSDLILLAHPGLPLEHCSVDLEVIQPETSSSSSSSKPKPSSNRNRNRNRNTHHKNSNNDHGKIIITSTVSTTAKTGIEMEALTSATITALNLVDMFKAVDKHIRIGNSMVTRKEGGKSGNWRARLPEEAWRVERPWKRYNEDVDDHEEQQQQQIQENDQASVVQTDRNLNPDPNPNPDLPPTPNQQSTAEGKSPNLRHQSPSPPEPTPGILTRKRRIPPPQPPPPPPPPSAASLPLYLDPSFHPSPDLDFNNHDNEYDDDEPNPSAPIFTDPDSYSLGLGLGMGTDLDMDVSSRSSRPIRSRHEHDTKSRSRNSRQVQSQDMNMDMDIDLGYLDREDHQDGPPSLPPSPSNTKQDPYDYADVEDAELDLDADADADADADVNEEEEMRRELEREEMEWRDGMMERGRRS